MNNGIVENTCGIVPSVAKNIEPQMVPLWDNYGNAGEKLLMWSSTCTKSGSGYTLRQVDSFRNIPEKMGEGFSMTQLEFFQRLFTGMGLEVCETTITPPAFAIPIASLLESMSIETEEGTFMLFFDENEKLTHLRLVHEEN